MYHLVRKYANIFIRGIFTSKLIAIPWSNNPVAIFVTTNLFHQNMAFRSFPDTRASKTYELGYQTKKL